MPFEPPVEKVAAAAGGPLAYWMKRAAQMLDRQVVYNETNKRWTVTVPIKGDGRNIAVLTANRSDSSPFKAVFRFAIFDDHRNVRVNAQHLSTGVDDPSTALFIHHMVDSALSPDVNAAVAAVRRHV